MGNTLLHETIGGRRDGEKIGVPEVRIFRIVPYDAGNMDDQRIIIDHRLAEHVGRRQVAKIKSRPALGQHEIVWRIQGARIARQPLVGEYGKKAGPGKNGAGLVQGARNMVLEFLAG